MLVFSLLCTVDQFIISWTVVSMMTATFFPSGIMIVLTNSVSPLPWSFSTAHIQIRPGFSLQALPTVKLSRLKKGESTWHWMQMLKIHSFLPFSWFTALENFYTMLSWYEEEGEALSTAQTAQCYSVWGPDSSDPKVHRVNYLWLHFSLPRKRHTFNFL